MKEGEYFGYPTEFVDPKTKNGKDYNLQMAKAFYAEWNHGGTHMLKSRHSKIIRNRLYADGDQSPELYKNLLRVKRNKSHVNLNWDIVAIIPKFLDVLMGYFEKLGENTVATAIDPVAIERYLEDKSILEAEIALQDDLKLIEAMLGKTQNKDFKPKNNEEIEIYMNTNYKQEWEIFLEEGLYLVSWLNKLDTEIKRQVIRSFLVDGIGFVKRYVENGKIKYEYCDTIELAIGFHKRADFADLTKIGQFKPSTIGDLRVMNDGSLSEEDLKEISEKQMGKNGNPKRETIYNKGNNGDLPYDSMKIEIFDFEYRTTNRHVWEKVQSKYGEKQFTTHQRPYNYKATNNEKRQVKKKDVNVWMKCKWIVGTDYVFDYGPVPDQVRDPDSLAESNSSFHGYQPSNKPHIERMIPFADGIQLKWLKLQNAVARARVKGVAIEVGGFEEVTDGKDVLSPLQIRAILDQEGDLLWRAKDVDDPNASANQFPFHELEGGIGNALQENVAGINFDLEMLRNVSGVSEIMDATLPNDPRQSATATKIAANQTTSALQIVYRGWISIKEATMQCTGDMLQTMVKRGDIIQGYIQALGSEIIRNVNVNPEIAYHDYGIRVEARPTEQEMMILEGQIQEALKIRSETGAGGIELEDAFAIRQVMQVSVKKAMHILIVRRNRRMAEDSEKQAAMMQQKSAMDQQSAAMAAEAQRQTKIIEAEAQKEILRTEYALKENLAKVEHELKMKEIALQMIGKEQDKSKQTV